MNTVGANECSCDTMWGTLVAGLGLHAYVHYTIPIYTALMSDES
jgi:hypothetical protein